MMPAQYVIWSKFHIQTTKKKKKNLKKMENTYKHTHIHSGKTKPE